MNPLVLTLTLQLVGSTPTIPSATQPVVQDTRSGDRWFAEDKLKHAFMSIAVVGFTHAGARTVGFDRSSSTMLGISAGVSAGIGKEIYDRKRGRPFSFRDLIYDAVGITLGALIVRNTRP